jgi:hypothetical protein
MAGLFMLILETIFTVDFVKSKGVKNHHIFKHSINHLIYPAILFIGVSVLFSVNDALYDVTSMIIIVLVSVLYFLHFYLLPVHLIQNETKKIEKTEYLLDFVFYLIKFISYFILNFSLFLAAYNNNIDKNYVVAINFFINFLYLYVHLKRNELDENLNVFMAVIFALITTIFTYFTFSKDPAFTSTSTLIFYYISSSIFYHKVAGTLNTKVIIEYSSIAIIASVLLFSIK